MSANNYILIKEQENRTYTVGMRDADTNKELGEQNEFLTLRGAVQQANKIQEEEIVEHGINIDLVK